VELGLIVPTRASESVKVLDRFVHAFCGEEKRWRIVSDEPVDEKCGEVPWSRPLARHLSLGVVNIDKPPGPTSHEVVAWIKKMLGVSKAGHGGTLERSSRPA